jgi:hypothetical protein
MPRSRIPLRGPEGAPGFAKQSSQASCELQNQAHELVMTETDVNAVRRRDRAIVVAALTTISVLAWASVRDAVYRFVVDTVGLGGARTASSCRQVRATGS